MSEKADPRMSTAGAEGEAAVRKGDDPHDRDSSNPFSTRHMRPGAIPYLFPTGDTAAAIVRRLEANSWRGEIIGPHGSGKSTLLCDLLPAIEAAGRRPILVALHDGERSLAAHRDALSAVTANSLLVIDGYEQLSRYSRWRVRRFCKSRGCGLLVTATHRSVYRRVVTTTVDLDTVLAVIRALADTPTIDLATIERSWHAHCGNVREVLFDLYDLHELHRSRRGEIRSHDNLRDLSLVKLRMAPEVPEAARRLRTSASLQSLQALQAARFC